MSRSKHQPLANRAQGFKLLSANERSVLRLIRDRAPISRAELARRTGLAIPSISRIAETLMSEGLVVAEEKVMMGRLGQPSLPLVLSETAAFALGVAVRSDSLAVTLSHLSGTVVAQAHERPLDLNRAHVEARIVDLATRLLAANGGEERLCGIGIALSGFFLEGQNRINAPLGMEDWAIDHLEAGMGERLGVPVVIENDGSAAAMGAHSHVATEGAASFAYLYIDRGLGGGVVLDGRLHRGFHGNAGEFTGLLPPEARADRPTLELLRRMLRDDGIAFETIALMLDAFDMRWPAVDRWLERVTPATDAVISAIASVLDPETVIIGGRLPGALASRLAERVACYTVPVRGRDRPFPKVGVLDGDCDMAAYGAGMLCLQNFFA